MKPQYRDAEKRAAALTEIWRRVLEKPDLDQNSDLFDHGGSSLHVLQIAGEVYDTLGAHVMLRNVFRNTSPQRLSDFLASQADSEAAIRP